MKHGKHAILWSTPSTPFYEARQERQFSEARQARHFMEHAKHVKNAKHVSTESTRADQTREHAKHVKHANHTSTQARHLADSIASTAGKMFEQNMAIKHSCLSTFAWNRSKREWMWKVNLTIEFGIKYGRRNSFTYSE